MQLPYIKHISGGIVGRVYKLTTNLDSSVSCMSNKNFQTANGGLLAFMVLNREVRVWKNALMSGVDVEVGYSCFDSFFPEILWEGKGREVTNLKLGQDMLSEIVTRHSFDTVLNISNLLALWWVDVGKKTVKIIFIVRIWESKLHRRSTNLSFLLSISNDIGRSPRSISDQVLFGRPIPC